MKQRRYSIFFDCRNICKIERGERFARVSHDLDFEEQHFVITSTCVKEVEECNSKDKSEGKERRE